MGEPDPTNGAPASVKSQEQTEGPSEASNGIQQRHLEYPKEGNMVILYGSRDNIISCILKPKGVCRTRFGNFAHENIMKTPIGHKVYDDRSSKWLAVLRPTPDLHTLALRHRTQIIYHADIALILSLLDAQPGKRIVEAAGNLSGFSSLQNAWGIPLGVMSAGTGSGSLSFSLARALRPGGRLFTFEFHEQRWREAKAEFEVLGISAEVESFHRDVCVDGFCEETSSPASRGAQDYEAELLPAPHSADGVFLDLPSPWLALKHADRVLKGGGRLVTFSPCVEQLHKTLAAAQELGFQDFQAFEVLAKPWGACISRPTPEQPPQPKKKRVQTSPQHCPEVGSDKEAQGAQEKDKSLGGSFPALLSHFLREPLPTFLSDVAESKRSARPPPAEVDLQSLSRISSYHYQLPMKGHTGYVAVCIRPNEDEASQPLP